MIKFRTKVEDLISKAIDHLKKTKTPYTVITPEKADEVSRVNSKAMVLVSFQRNEYGRYQIQVMDKELYRYTQKLLKETCGMRILDVDKKTRIVTAETDHEGVALDIIEILGLKYNLSVVQNKK